MNKKEIFAVVSLAHNETIGPTINKMLCDLPNDEERLIAYMMIAHALLIGLGELIKSQPRNAPKDWPPARVALTALHKAALDSNYFQDMKSPKRH